MHRFPGAETIVQANGHIGCRIGKNSLIGMNAIVIDGAVVGESCIVAALAFV